MPGSKGKTAIGHQALIDLALADMPAKSRQLTILELAGIPTSEALDMLGVTRGNRARTITGRNKAASILKQTPRNRLHQN